MKHGVRGRNTACFVLACALATACANTGAAQEEVGYPSRPIRLVVPFTPGGAADIFARLLSEKLTAALRQQVVIDNRGGGGGSIGAEIVAHARPDGYTLLLANTGPNAIDASLRPRSSYDAIRDFAPVTQISSVPLVLDIHGGLGVRSVEELIALAKDKPDQVTYASAGNGSIAHLTTELFKNKLGVKMTHVPYKGTAPALTDLMAGQVLIMFTTTVSSLSYIKSGRLRAIALADKARSPLLPDVPTMEEAGVSDFEVAAWYGLVAPAKTPRAVVSRLHGESVKALRMADVRKRFEASGAVAIGSDPEAFGAFLRSETERWRKAARLSGAKVE